MQNGIYSRSKRLATNPPILQVKYLHGIVDPPGILIGGRVDDGVNNILGLNDVSGLAVLGLVGLHVGLELVTVLVLPDDGAVLPVAPALVLGAGGGRVAEAPDVAEDVRALDLEELVLALAVFPGRVIFLAGLTRNLRRGCRMIHRYYINTRMITVKY